MTYSLQDLCDEIQQRGGSIKLEEIHRVERYRDYIHVCHGHSESKILTGSFIQKMRRKYS